MRTTNWQRAVTLIITLNFLLTGCTSFQGVSLPGRDQPTATPAVKVGETVLVTTRAGETKRFKVTAVESDALVGDNVRVAYSDMTSLQALRVEKGETHIAIWVTLGVIVLGALIWGFEHLGAAGGAS